MSDSMTSIVFGVAGGDPPTTTGSTLTNIPSSLDPNSRRVDPHLVIEFDDFVVTPLGSGPPSYLLSQFVQLVSLDANETNNQSGLGNVTPRVPVGGLMMRWGSYSISIRSTRRPQQQRH